MSLTSHPISSVQEFRSPAWLRTAQGIVCAVAFSLLLAGTNAATPLLPVYRSVLSFSPLMMTLTFVIYVSVLICVLLALSRPTLVRWSPPMLCAAVLLAALSDTLLATATETGILAGRAVAGVAGGLGTGSAAALVVAVLGARGRSISATGNLAGAVVGTTFSQILVSSLGPAAMHWTFIVHAVVCIVIAAILSVILYLRGPENRAAMHVGTISTDGVLPVLRSKLFPVAVGCLAWVMLSAGIVLLPSFFGEVGMPAVRTFGVILFLVLSAGGQLASPYLMRWTPWASGVFAMAMGGILLVVGGIHQQPVLAMAGFACLGVGTGISYRLSLVVLTKGAPPATHGALSSLYAATTYAAAASGVLLSGLAGNRFGLVETTVFVFSALSIAALSALPKAPRLRDVAY